MTVFSLRQQLGDEGRMAAITQVHHVVHSVAVWVLFTVSHRQ